MPATRPSSHPKTLAEPALPAAGSLRVDGQWRGDTGGLGGLALAGWPLHDAAGTRVLEQAAQQASPHPPLMARAGLALARLARAIAPHARRTLVLAGPGNNGGDGLVAARLLHTARHDVQVRLVGDPARQPADAAQALRLAEAAGVPIRRFDPAEAWVLGPQDLAIDALLGIGSHRAPEGALAQAIQRWAGLQALGLAVDIPSGLHPDTGALLGAQAVRATATLALLTIKPGCFTAQGRDHAGQVWWNDLGLPTPTPRARLLTRPMRHERPHVGHKGLFGDVWLLGGAAGMEGALVLAAHAALAAGAGRVLACSLAPGAMPRTRAEVMHRPLAEALLPGPLESAVTVAGCGAGQTIAAALPQLLAQAGRLLLDADALNAVAASPALQQALRDRRGQGRVTVLTPHPLEAARLLGSTRDQVQSDRLAAAAVLAERLQCLVVLKGSGTVIATPDGQAYINPTGNAALGTAGTGDVLAGWAGGLWAQAGRATTPEPGACAEATALRAACAAVWLHGAAADNWLATGHAGPLRAGNLIECLAQR